MSNYLTPGIISHVPTARCMQPSLHKKRKACVCIKNTQKSTFLSAYAVACTAKSPPLGRNLISVDSVSPSLTLIAALWEARLYTSNNNTQKGCPSKSAIDHAPTWVGGATHITNTFYTNMHNMAYTLTTRLTWLTNPTPNSSNGTPISSRGLVLMGVSHHHNNMFPHFPYGYDDLLH